MIAVAAEYRCEDKIGPGSLVLDLGANIGTFTEWALEQGAHVTAVEPIGDNLNRLRARTHGRRARIIAAAVGARDGSCRLAPAGTQGTEASTSWHVVEGDGPVPMVSLESLLTHPFDVVKADIEGSEYEVFGSTPPEVLGRIAFLTMEFHAWRGPDEPEDGARGQRSYAMEPGMFGQMLERLSVTHDVCVSGSARAGGMIWGSRR